MPVMEQDIIPILLLTDDQQRDRDLAQMPTWPQVLEAHLDRPLKQLCVLTCGSVILALSLGFSNCKTKY